GALVTRRTPLWCPLAPLRRVMRPSALCSRWRHSYNGSFLPALCCKAMSQKPSSKKRKQTWLKKEQPGIPGLSNTSFKISILVLVWPAELQETSQYPLSLDASASAELQLPWPG